MSNLWKNIKTIYKMSNGWINLHRCIQEHWIWKDAHRFKWWVDLLLRASHKDTKVLIDGSLMECKRGQFITSLGKLAEEWMVSRDTVRRFLDALENDTMIARVSTHKMTQITICNYDSYQSEPTTDTTTDRQPTLQQTDTINNIDNISTSRNILSNKREGGKKTHVKFTPPTLEEVTAYCKERGNDVNAEKWFNHYTTVGWMVGKNKMKDWRAAVRKWENSEYDRKPTTGTNPNKAQYRNPAASYSSESDI